LAPTLVIFLVALGLGLVVSQALRGQHLAARVGMVSGVTGILLGASVWRLGLEGSQRNRVLRSLGFV